MFVVVSYDIPDDKRRLKVMKTLKNFGAHVQYSVFECDLSVKQYRRLRSRLSKIVKPEKDDVRFYFLCETCMRKMRRLGRPRDPVREDYYLI
ncbi:MAG: CRISPR-associated endonuclease Cas2 [Anaerolineae bacterium]